MTLFFILIFYASAIYSSLADPLKVCQKNGYYYGNLIEIVDNITNVEECISRCNKNSQCNSANHVNHRQKCELMGDVPRILEDIDTEEDSAFISKTCKPITNAVESLLLRAKRAETCVAKCGLPKIQARSTSTRIVGGYEAKPHSFPWVASIQQFGRHRCGASLIPEEGECNQSRYVLSASHCFFELNNDALTVKFGANDLSKTETTVDVVEVEKIYEHENYDPEKVINDIAIIKLARPVKFTDYIQPVCLPMQFQVTKVNTVCTAAGWGATAEAGPSSSKLLQVELPVMDINVCNRTDWAYHGTLTKDEMICAGYEKGAKDACQGDSGGPLFYQQINKAFAQVGVVSFGEGCAQEKSPGIYSKVSNYVFWIKQKQKEAFSTKVPTTKTTTTTTTTTTKPTTTTQRRRKWKPVKKPGKPWNKPNKPWWANYNNWNY